ncbi:uncharacterized protein LOC132202861 [Neocloeon triangulifer]|uniref:uncharacterized protein LOC132202861 n=1 Tax=Neocloeon triangulifer TaxID=2078957 RepID=UPI00286FA755|nr:uncharacterized protein LOC132202861 [Neocloeon triangulifer]
MEVLSFFLALCSLVSAKPYFGLFDLPSHNSIVQIVPSVQTHEEHSSLYYPFNFGDLHDHSQFVFLGQSKFIDDIIGNKKPQKFQSADQVYFTSTASPLPRQPAVSNLPVPSLPSPFAAFLAGGPDPLPFTAPIFVSDFTQAFFQPHLVPYNDTLQPPPSRQPSAGSLTSPQNATEQVSLPDKTAPTTTEPIFAHQQQEASEMSFNGTEAFFQSHLVPYNNTLQPPPSRQPSAGSLTSPQNATEQGSLPDRTAPTTTERIFALQQQAASEMSFNGTEVPPNQIDSNANNNRTQRDSRVETPPKSSNPSNESDLFNTKN